MRKLGKSIRLFIVSIAAGVLFSPLAQAITVNTNDTDATDSKCSFTEALLQYVSSSPLGHGCDNTDKTEIIFNYGMETTDLELNRLTLPIAISTSLTIKTRQTNAPDYNKLEVILKDNIRTVQQALFDVSSGQSLNLYGLVFDGSSLSKDKTSKPITLVTLGSGSNLQLKNSGVTNMGSYTSKTDYALSTKALIDSISNKAGNVFVEKSTFKNNQTTAQAVVLNVKAAKLSIQNSVFEHNENIFQTANSGGVIRIDGAAVKIKNSQFINNYNWGGKGGALHSSTASQFDVINSSFISNYSAGEGSAIFSTSNLSLYSSSVLFGFSNTVNGGALHVGTGGSLKLINSLLDFNVDKNRSKQDCVATLNLASSHSLIGKGSNTANCNLVAGVTELTKLSEIYTKKNDKNIRVWYSPVAGGNIYNHANPAGCKDDANSIISKDVYGNKRTANGRCDIGAAEVQAFNVSLTADVKEYHLNWGNNLIESEDVFVEFKVTNNSAEKIDGLNISFAVPTQLYVGGSEGDGSNMKLWSDLDLDANEVKTIRLKLNTRNKSLDYDMPVKLYHPNSNFDNLGKQTQVSIKLKSVAKNSSGGSGLGGDSSSGGGAMLWLLLLPLLGLFRRKSQFIK